MTAPVVLRPVRSADADAIWELLESSRSLTVGMTSLPSSRGGAGELCRRSEETITDLATGGFNLHEGEKRRVVMAMFDPETGAALGTCGVSFKDRVPNLVVRVATSVEGTGLTMRSVSAPWTRTELDSIFLGSDGRGRGLGTLLSRGRFLLLHLVRSQIPNTLASHLRGRFDEDGYAIFWNCFGAHFAPWENSIVAEEALAARPERLEDLADLVLPLKAEVLESLGLVNAASLNAFRMLMQEGLRANGMYDPIDGGPTVAADINEITTAERRIHGPVLKNDPAAGTDLVDALVSSSTISDLRIVRTVISQDNLRRVSMESCAITALGVDEGSLVTALPLAPVVTQEIRNG